MDDTFRENDFVEDQDLHAREIKPSSEKSQKNIINDIRIEPTSRELYLTAISSKSAIWHVFYVTGRRAVSDSVINLNLKEILL